METLIIGSSGSFSEYRKDTWICVFLMLKLYLVSHKSKAEREAEWQSSAYSALHGKWITSAELNKLEEYESCLCVALGVPAELPFHCFKKTGQLDSDAKYNPIHMMGTELLGAVEVRLISTWLAKEAQNSSSVSSTVNLVPLTRHIH